MYGKKFTGMSFYSRDKSKFDGRIGLLKIFAGIINPSETSEIDITLNVHGTIVSGKIRRNSFSFLGLNFNKFRSFPIFTLSIVTTII